MPQDYVTATEPQLGNRSNKIDCILRRFNITVPVPDQNIPVQFDPSAEKLQIAGVHFTFDHVNIGTDSDLDHFGWNGLRAEGDLYTNVVPSISFGRNPDDKR